MSYLIRFSILERVLFILIAIFTNIIIGLSASLIASAYFPHAMEISMLKDWSGTTLFLVTVLLAPLMETLLFQFAIMESIYHYKGINRKSTLAAISCSSLVFGMMHLYSVPYLLMTTLIGVALATTYHLAKMRKDISPFFLVAGIHALMNFLAYLVDELL